MINVVAAVIQQDDQIYCFKKGAAKYPYLSHKFEFPGGKVERDEDHSSALIREIKEELDTDIIVEHHLLSVTHAYPDFTIRLHFYACQIAPDDKGESRIKRLTEHTEYVCLDIDKLHSVEWLPADLPAVDYLLANADIKPL